MQLNTVSILDTLKSLNVPQEDRGYLLSIALAHAIGYRTPVPAEPVANPYEFFVSSYRASVEAELAVLNERVIINLDGVFGLIFALWSFRYNLVHNMANTATRDFLDALVRVGDRAIPAQVSELLVRYEKNDAIAVLARAMGVTGVVNGG